MTRTLLIHRHVVAFGASRAVAAPMARLTPIMKMILAAELISIASTRPPPRGPDIERFDRSRECHGEVDIAARNVHVESIPTKATPIDE